MRRSVVPALAAAFAVLHGALWAFTLPPDGGPDERDHLVVASAIARTGRIPILGDDGLTYSDVPLASYAPTPPLAYACAAGSIALGRALGGSDPLFWARLTGLAWAALFGWSAARVGRFLFPRRRDLEVAFAALACGLPQVGFTFGYFASDAALLAAGMFHASVLLEASRRPDGAAMRLGLASGLVLASKLTGFAVVGLGLAWLATFAPRRLRARAARTAIAAGAIGVLCIAPWLVHNALVYHANPISPWLVFLPGGPERMARQRALFEARLGRFPDLDWLHVWTAITFRSAIGYFGYVTRPLPDHVYAAALWAFGLGGLGWVVEVLRAASARAGGGLARRRRALLFWAIAVGLVAVSMRHSATFDFQPQGRYLFGGLAAYVWLVLKGWGLSLPRRVARMPWGWLLAAAMPSLAVAAWRAGIVQYAR